MGTNWLQNATIYHILIDRFSTGNEAKDVELGGKTVNDWMGGNLKGIIKRANYLTKLGINALYLSPIYKGRYYHGYHVTDYFKVDPHFGSAKEFKNLIRLYHRNDIKIILDFVPNHCSNNHPFFLDAQMNRDSKYRDWFVFKKWPNYYECFLDVKELPKINLDNPDAKEYILSTAEYWVREYDIDGFRIDHALGLPKNFLKDLRKRTNELKDNFVLIGEVWLRGIKAKNLPTLWLLRDFSREEAKELIKGRNIIEKSRLILEKINEMKLLDGCLDFYFMELLWECVKQKHENFEECKEKLYKHYSRFNKNFYLITFLSNHDKGRFIYHCGNDVNIVKDFSSFQFSLHHPTILYYGEEIGLTQKAPVKSGVKYADLEARRFMIWNSQRWNKELFEHYKKLCRLRRSS